MNDNKITDVIVTLSSLYELLLNIGKSFDTQENAEEFLKTLMQQNNLSFAAYFTLESTYEIAKVHSIPIIPIEKLEVEFDLSKDFVRNKFTIINETHSSFKNIARLTKFVQNEFAIYFAGSKSIIILGKNKDSFVYKDLVKYELVLSKFGLFMESLESHHKIKDEIRIKEEQAETIKANNEKLKRQNYDLLNYIRSNSELEQFAYRVSHDLNSPLRSIIAFSGILKRQTDGKITEKQSEYLDFIVSSGLQMRELISGILDYSSIAGSQLKLKQINVLKLLDSIRNLLYNSLEEAKGKIIVENIPEFIVADEIKVTQLFLNLISNALKFKRENVNVEVTVRGLANKEGYQFSIIDNGIGIPYESQDKIFELFGKAENNIKVEGHGIGLSTCRQIAEQHQGRIWLESIPNQGTTFHFTIKEMDLLQGIT